VTGQVTEVSTFDEGFDGELRPGKRPAVLAIDLMRAYFDPDSPLCLPSRDCLSSGARVLAAARSHGVPVIHTRVELAPDGRDGGIFVRKVPALEHLYGGGPMSQLMPEVAPAEGELVITKQYASAFFGTSLAPLLHAQGIDTVVLAGCSTSGCIRASAVDALQHGLRTIVVRECVGDRHPAPHEANLFDIDSKYGDVVSLQEAMAQLQRLAS
jgi:maleamate amidohydrolase